MENTKNVLMICGSFRKKSLNKQMGIFAQNALVSANSNINVTWLEYADLPYMNQDAEFPTPPEVQRMRNEVIAADALWILSPEYNRGMPGALKNCIDWLSRPLAQDANETAIQGKLVTYSCAGGGAVARYVAAQLAETLTFVGAQLINTAHAQVALNRQDYTTDVLTLSDTEKMALTTQANILASLVGC